MKLILLLEIYFRQANLLFFRFIIPLRTLLLFRPFAHWFSLCMMSPLSDKINLLFKVMVDIVRRWAILTYSSFVDSLLRIEPLSFPLTLSEYDLARFSNHRLFKGKGERSLLIIWFSDALIFFTWLIACSIWFTLWLTNYHSFIECLNKFPILLLLSLVSFLCLSPLWYKSLIFLNFLLVIGLLIN